MNTIIGKTFKNLILSENFSIKKFIKCDFEDVVFNDWQDLKFDYCTFKGCKFSGRHLYQKKTNDEAKNRNRNLSFFGNIKTDLKIEDCTLGDVEFLECDLSAVIVRNAKLDGRFELHYCTGNKSVIFTDSVEFGSNYAEKINYQKENNDLPFFRWSKIRLMVDLPIPKIGFSLLSIYFLFAPIFNYIFYELCSSISLEKRINRSQCSEAIFQASAYDYALIGTLIVFIICSVIHKIYSPPLVNKYSLNEWSVVMGRSKIYYDNRDCNFSLLLKVISFIYILSLFSLSFFYFRRASEFLPFVIQI